MTKRCPGKCGRVLHAEKVCTSCRERLSFTQRAKLNTGFLDTDGLTAIFAALSNSNITTTHTSDSGWSGPSYTSYDSGSSGGSSYSGGSDSGSSGGGGFDGGGSY